MTDAFTPEAARALGGPDWLVERRRARGRAARRRRRGRPPSEEIWRYSRIDELDLDRYRPFDRGRARPAPATSARPAAARGRPRPASTPALVVVRDGRVVHHELDDDARGQGRASSAASRRATATTSAAGSGTCSDASPDAFTVLHDAFLAGGAFIHVPGRRGGREADRRPALVATATGRASFPHTLVSLGEERARSRCSTASARPDVDHLVDAVVELIVGDNAHVRYLSVQEHGPRTWQIALQRAHVGRDATLRSSAVALGGDYARLRSESLLTGEGAESDLLAVYFGDQRADARLPHAAGPRRAAHAQRPAVQGRGRGRRPLGVLRAHPAAARRRRRRTPTRPTATSCSARARARSRSRTSRSRPTTCSCSHASTVGPIDDDQLYYLESRGIPPDDAERLIVLGFFEDVLDRLPVAVARRRAAPRRWSRRSSTGACAA